MTLNRDFVPATIVQKETASSTKACRGTGRWASSAVICSTCLTPMMRDGEEDIRDEKRRGLRTVRRLARSNVVTEGSVLWKYHRCFLGNLVDDSNNRRPWLFQRYPL